LVHRHLKKWRQAIADYDHVLELKPNDYVVLNDRGLAKMEIGNTYDAISDFTKAIKLRERKLQETMSLEARADAYTKTQQWRLAIRDYDTAIALQVGGVLPVINIKQFRALYPEYTTVSDETLARKLQQTFHPGWDFREGFLRPNQEQSRFETFVIQE